jgi:hypothetical protein
MISRRSAMSRLDPVGFVMDGLEGAGGRSASRLFAGQVVIVEIPQLGGRLLWL